jgi:hypothetical protein
MNDARLPSQHRLVVNTKTALPERLRCWERGHVFVSTAPSALTITTDRASRDFGPASAGFCSRLKEGGGVIEPRWHATRLRGARRLDSDHGSLDDSFTTSRGNSYARQNVSHDDRPRSSGEGAT